MKPDSSHQLELSSNRTQNWIGAGLFLLSGFGFAVTILFGTMAFNDGLNVNTTNAVRYSVAFILLFLFQKIRRRQLKLPRRDRYKALALGISVFVTGFGYLSATQYVPVSLAVLVFYSFPVFVAVTTRFTENEPVTLLRLSAIIIALIGLGLALKVQSAATLDWRGIGFGLLASFGCVALVTMSSLTMRTADPQAVNFHCLASAALLFAAFLLLTGSLATHITYSGCLKLSISSLALALGYMTFFAGVELIGPVRSAVLMNMEPIFTIGLAALWLDERLSSIQFLGAGLVIFGVILVTTGSRYVKD